MSKAYNITLSDDAVNFEPEAEDREIIQNVITICTTLKGSRPLDRNFGITPLIVDRPLTREQARITEEIINAVAKYEPRAEILSVGLGGAKDAQGISKLVPEISVRVKR